MHELRGRKERTGRGPKCIGNKFETATHSTAAAELVIFKSSQKLFPLMFVVKEADSEFKN